MAITRKERDKLRKRLRKCYRLKYADNKTKLAHIDSTNKAESNPFIKILRVDINERFKDEDIDGNDKNSRGFSLSTFSRLFDLDDYLNFHHDTIRKLNQYCNEIEKITLPNKKVKTIFKQNYIRSLTIIIIILTIGVVLYQLINERNNIGDKEIKAEDISNCLFKSDSTKHKILILPFKDYNSDIKNRDSGRIIAERLDSLNKSDGLNLEISYCEKINPTTTDISFYENLKRQFNADHIIYGFYSKDEANCSSIANSKRMVCLNYITEFSNPFESISKKFTHSSYGNFKQASLKKLNEGYLQEDIDFLIYYSALQLSINNKEKKNSTIRYLDKLIEFGREETYGRLFTITSEFNYRYFNDYFAIIAALTALEYISPDDKWIQAVAHNIIGKVYAIYGKDDRARYHFIKSYQKDIRATSFDFLFRVNFKLNYLEDNIKLTEAFLKEIGKTNTFEEEEKFNFLYINSFTKKLLNSKYDFKSDSINITKNYKKRYQKDFKIPFSTKFNSWNNALYNRLVKSLFDGRKNDPIIYLKKGEDIASIYAKINYIHGLLPELIEYAFGDNVVIMDGNKKVVKGLNEVVINSNRNLNFIYSTDISYRKISRLKSIKIYHNK